jgi:ArsR family metal-binding transcriptional regulator
MNLEDLIPPGMFLDKVKALILEVEDRIGEASLNYKFTMQMIGDEQQLPSADILTLIIAKRYAEHMNQWDGTDMFLPFLFARLTVKEMLG